MNNPHIKGITAVTEVLPSGQRCTGARIEYDCALEAGQPLAEAFRVEGRTITEAFLCDGNGTQAALAGAGGSSVMLVLSPEDETAATYFPGNPWEKREAGIITPRLLVSQILPLAAADGSAISEGSTDESAAVENRLVDEFTQGTFEGLPYNLFIPKNYDSAKSYPLVQFIHDAAVCSHDVRCTLAQGVGALVWMTPEAQAKEECFVLAPQFAPPTIVEDDWSVDDRLEWEKRLLEHIVSAYSIDAGRLYTTGQSMGCMSSMVLNLRYPDLFAASLFVAGQWDERQFVGSGLEKKHFWFINSMGDAKAFPGMNQILVALERDGAKVAREVWRTGETQETYREKTQALAADGANMIYTPFEITTVADGWHSDGGEHHVNTWRYAYSIEAVREWMFAQRN